MTETRTNPFPVEAVATYGKAVKTTCDKLQYMRQARDQLTDYLARYPKSKDRYGAGIGLQGATAPEKHTC
jgi:hypothetical protein